MTGQIDHLSEAIGNLRADVRNLMRSLDMDRNTANERHEDNTSRLQSIEKVLGPLETTVAELKPIVQRYEVTRWKVIGAVTALGGIGYLLIDIVLKYVSHLLKPGV